VCVCVCVCSQSSENIVLLLNREFLLTTLNKKALRGAQTLHAACSKAGATWSKSNQLERATSFTYRPSFFFE